MLKVSSWLLFLYFALFPFGQLTRIPMQLAGFPEVNIYATDIVIGVIAFLWVFNFRSNLPTTFPFLKEFSGFLGIAVFSLLLATFNLGLREIFVGSLYLVRWVAYAMVFFAVFKLVKREELSRNLIYGSLIAVGSFVSLFGWIQYFLFPDLRPFTIFGWDEHYLRLFGTFLDPGFTAIIIVLTTLLALNEFRRINTVKLTQAKSLLLLLLVFLFASLAFTYSRSGYLALITGLVVFSILKKDIRPFIFGLASLVLVVLFLPRPASEGARLERQVSTWARFENWGETFGIASKSPLFGVGFNTLRYVREEPNVNQAYFPPHSAAGSDSSLLFVLATTGIVGLILYLSLWTRIVLSVDTSFIPIIAAIFIHSLFLNSLFYPWVMGYIWILLGALKFKE